MMRHAAKSKKQGRKGIFIALEGVDGSGKTTQKELIVKRLTKEGYPVREIKFPQYHEPSAWQIEQYLNGFFGPVDKVDPYFASLLYADDRNAVKSEIEQWLKEGTTIIADRYTASNAGHQGGKITDLKKRKRYLEWLWKTEFEINKIPVPDLNIILWIPPTLAYRLIFKKGKRDYLKREKRRDGHERNIAHLKRAAASYKWLLRQDPKHFMLIPCVKNGKLQTPEEIHEKIRKIVQQRLLSRKHSFSPR